MTEIQKKVIRHSLEELSKVETYKIYSAVNDKVYSINMIETDKKSIMKELEISTTNNVSKHVKSVKEWLTALLEDK